MPNDSGFTPNENWNPRRTALRMGLLDNEDEYSDPERSSLRLGLTNSEKNYQAGIEEPEPEQENYLDDSFGSFTRNLPIDGLDQTIGRRDALFNELGVKLPIDQPNGSIVSGGREDLYHKYSQMLEQKPESERVLEDFMGRRPTFANYNPSGGDKLNAAAMGIAGALNKGPEYGIERAQEWRNKPFERSVQDYNSEGRYVNEYAKLADSSRNRQMTSLLSQMRMQEQERVNRAREKNNESLDSYRRGMLEDRKADNERAVKDKEYSRDFDERKFGETQRHNKSTEDRLLKSLNFRESKSNEKKPLTPQAQLAQRKLNSERLMGTDPRFISMMGKYQTDPEAFLDDNTQDTDTADARRQFALYQMIMQMAEGNQ